MFIRRLFAFKNAKNFISFVVCKSSRRRRRRTGPRHIRPVPFEFGHEFSSENDTLLLLLDVLLLNTAGVTLQRSVKRLYLSGIPNYK